MSDRACEVCGGGAFREMFRKDDHRFVQCAACHLIRIDPQPTDHTLEQIYGTHYYDAWGIQSDRSDVKELKSATFRRHLRTISDLPHSARVLDCGAAFGFMMEVAAEMGFDPYGVELASDAAARIADRFGADHVFVGPFEEAKFPGLGPQPFDLVCMFDFIEHVRRPLVTLKKAASMLSPGGHLLITTPAGGSISRRLMGVSWLHLKVEHLYYFNRRNLMQLLSAAKFRTVRIRAARKFMNIEYVCNQLNTYPRAGITSAINLLRAILPARIGRQHFPIIFGEILVHARKELRAES